MFSSIMHKFSIPNQEILKESFEIAQDYSDYLHFYDIQVEASLLVLGDDDEAKRFVEFVENYQKQKYKVGLLSPKDILSINGHLGNFEAKISIAGEIHSLKFAQMVLFYEDENLMRFMGCENAQDYKNAQELLEVLDSRLGNYTYHNIIFYDSKKCQYHHRRANKQGEGYCHQCVDVCPTFGVSKNDSLMELQFSALDCISCGACVNVCPSGSVQRDAYDKKSIYEIAKLYKDIVPVVCNQEDLINFGNIDFLDSLPFVLVQTHLLNETYLLSIIQESGAQMVLFDSKQNARLQASVQFINQIFQKIFQKDAILLASNLEELQKQIACASVCKEFFYTYMQDKNEALRSIFAQRLRFMIKNNDFGKIPNYNQTYGRIFVNQEKCTLCMGCVGACNVQSLSAGDFSLLHNPSLCTTCGYCVDSCPEDAISVDFEGLYLNASWFENNILAKDKGFRCVECGKVFATTKSIEKIKGIMTPIFSNDKERLKTLECCEECKVKVMFGV